VAPVRRRRQFCGKLGHRHAGVTITALIWLPLDAPVVLGIGAIGTLLSHAVLTAFHESLDAAEDLAV
jgi:hypothetical protein